MRRRRSSEGATTVEFALVLPVFIALIGIGMYFAWIFYQQSQLDRAANRAARTAAVPTTTGQYTFCADLVQKQVNGDLIAGKITDPNDVVVSDAQSNAAPQSTNGICSAIPEGFVRVRLTHEFGNPFGEIVSIFSGGDGKLSLTSTGQVRVEHQ